MSSYRITIVITVAFAVACSAQTSERDSSSARTPPPPPTPPPASTAPVQPPATPPQAPRPPVAPPPAQPVVPGECSDDCIERGVGTGGMAFDLGQNPGESVEVDGDGALVITRSAGEVASFIWIADSAADPGTIAKVDTRSERIVARYELGARDPSRTSVAMNGDAYVASRGGMGVTKISTLGAECPDTNGDGMITTSTGPDDVLPFGQDDCVLWFRQFDQEVRGIAAQDIPGRNEVEPQPDGVPVVTHIPEQHFVWVGASTVGYDENAATATPPNAIAAPRAYKLDGDTGEILIDTAMPRGAYGFALDGRGILWLTGGAYWSGNLAFIDTNQCVDDASCDVTPCRSTCSATLCPATCDGAVKADVTLEPSDTYGITVDCKQRVWLGSTVKRYDPLAPADARLAISQLTLPTTSFVAGIAADAYGWVWGAGGQILRIDADTMQQATEVAIPESANGVAVDIDGKVWAIGGGQSASTIVPGAGLMDNAVRGAAVTGLNGPYTYSDMTGVQQRLAANNEPGIYNHVFEGCEGELPTNWADFTFDTDTPDGTRILFQARTADTMEALEDGVWQPLASAPATTNEAALGTALMLSGKTPGKYVEIRAELYMDPVATNKCNDDTAVSPKLKGFTVSFSCPPPPPSGPG